MIIPKKWGYEDVAINENYCMKRMVIKEQFRCSIHMHITKDEVLMVGSEGLLWYESGTSPHTMNGIFLQENDRVRVTPGTWHRFTALRDTSLYESSTHHEDDDVRRDEESGIISEETYRALLISFFKYSNKKRLISMSDAQEISAGLHSCGRTIGMCNGCFDLFHIGHAELLLQAKQRCNILFVAINSDNSIKKLKGDSRPFVDELGRIGVLLSNKNVDYVILNEKTTCIDVVKAIRPDIYVTTSEYQDKGPEAREVISQGGRVDFIDMIPEYNTTKIADKISSVSK